MNAVKGTRSMSSDEVTFALRGGRVVIQFPAMEVKTVPGLSVSEEYSFDRVGVDWLIERLNAFKALLPE